jgi:hypothetical protein
VSGGANHRRDIVTPITPNKRNQQYAPWFAFGASCFFDE